MEDQPQQWMTIMDDDKNTNEKRLSMDEILKNLLSCSEQVDTLEKVVHVYDPKELQSGWQPVISNPKYIACPDKRERVSPSVKSDSSTKSCPTQKRNAYKEKRKDFRQESISVKFNKYESLGVLSYGVPSWRTIVDPETCTYVKRNHPCYSINDASTRETNRGLPFLDPGGALDQHLGSFVKRQRENNVLQSHLGDNIGTPIGYDQLRANCSVEFPAKPHNLSQNNVLLPSEGLIRQPLRPKDVFQPGDITVASMTKPEKIASVPLHIFKHQKPGIHNSCIPLSRRELSPLLTSSRVVAVEKNIPGKRPRDLAQIRQPKRFPSVNKPFMPVSFQIVKQGKRARANQKLNWLPITSTTPCVSKQFSVGPSDDPEAVWSRTARLVHNPITKAITHLKSQIPVERQRIALAHELKAHVPTKVLELPLASTGLN